MNVRKTQPGDASTLGHIQVTSWRSAFRNIASDEYLDDHVNEENQTNDWKEILADPAQVVLLAEAGDKIVGYVWAHEEIDPAIAWNTELISMHILPEHKRQGIGKKLFRAVALQFGEQGCASLYLWVLEDNHPARKFYEALGGKLAGEHQIRLGDRELTEVVYEWKDIHHLEKLG